MKAIVIRVNLTSALVAVAAVLGACAARAETEPVTVSDIFGDYQLYHYLHPWPSGARARDLDAEAPVPPALPCRSYGFLEVTTEGYRRVGRFQVGGCRVRRRRSTPTLCCRNRTPIRELAGLNVGSGAQCLSRAYVADRRIQQPTSPVTISN